MAEVHQPVHNAPIAPAAAVDELNAPATQATADPIRPTGTDTLVPESRPEVTSAPDATTGTSAAAAADVTEEKLGATDASATALLMIV